MNTVTFEYEKLKSSEKKVYDNMTANEKVRYEKLWEQIEGNKIKMEQQMHKAKERQQREEKTLAKQKRNQRTHRLIEMGAMLDRMIPVDFNNEEINKLIKYCLGSEYAIQCIQVIRHRRNNNTQ